MYYFVGTSFVADAGLGMFSEKGHNHEGVFLVGLRSRRGGCWNKRER